MLKKILIIQFIVQTLVFAKVNAVVSILPQQSFLKEIGGDKVNVSLMVKPGNSPHNYEPKPLQMMELAKADVYFSIDVEFEKIWLSKFKSQNKNMKIIDLSNGIIKIPMISKHNNKHKKMDPHIWTSPKNVKIIAKNIYIALVDLDGKNKNYYKKNFDKFINNINQTDMKIKNILSNIKQNSSFMVFHPAWGYFAKQYSLKQFPVEIEGKTPKPKELVYIIRQSKKENIKAIFTQPEFSDKSAKIIAEQLNIKVIKASPLSAKWSENLIKLTKTIAE